MVFWGFTVSRINAHRGSPDHVMMTHSTIAPCYLVAVGLLLGVALSCGGSVMSDTPGRSVVVKVAEDGSLWIGDREMKMKPEITPPQALVDGEKQAVPPLFEGSKAVWYAFPRLGLIARRDVDPIGDDLVVTLPYVASADFPAIQYKGVLMLEQTSIDFGGVTRHSRESLLKLLRGSQKNPVEEVGHVAVDCGGRTSVYFTFDLEGQLAFASLSKPPSRR